MGRPLILAVRQSASVSHFLSRATDEAALCGFKPRRPWARVESFEPPTDWLPLLVCPDCLDRSGRSPTAKRDEKTAARKH